MNFFQYLLNYKNHRIEIAKERIKYLDKVRDDFFEENKSTRDAMSEMNTEEKISEIFRLLYNFITKEEFIKRTEHVKLCQREKARLEKWLEKNQERIEQI